MSKQPQTLAEALVVIAALRSELAALRAPPPLIAVIATSVGTSVIAAEVLDLANAKRAEHQSLGLDPHPLVAEIDLAGVRTPQDLSRALKAGGATPGPQTGGRRLWSLPR